MICITARVGSTALVSALASTGLAKEILEVFNSRFMLNELQNKYQAKSKQEFLNKYFKENMKTDKLIFKTNYGDFINFFATDLNEFQRLLPNLSCIYIVRASIDLWIPFLGFALRIVLPQNKGLTN